MNERTQMGPPSLISRGPFCRSSGVWGPRTGVMAAAKKPALRKWRAKKTGTAKQEQRVSEAELLRELNASNDWMLSDDPDDGFGMEAVAAHAQRGGDEPAEPPPQQQGGKAQGSGSGKSGRGGGAGGGAPSPLDELAAAAAAAAVGGRGAPAPAWVRQLQADGFSVAARGGEVFLTRGAPAGAPPPAQPARTRAAAPAAAGRPRGGAAAGKGGPAGAAAFEVGPEFSAERWGAALARGGGRGAGARGPSAQQTFDEEDGEEEAGPPGADGAEGGEGAGPAGEGSSWWLGGAAGDAAEALLTHADAAAPPGGGGGGGAAAPPPAQQAAGEAGQRPAPQVGAALGGGAAGWQQRAAAAARVRGALQRGDSPEQLLRLAEAAYPLWAANGCRLLDMARGAPVEAPGPAEAAAMLKGAALAARRRRFKPAQMMSLARDRRVRGLAECLRVTPPRADDGAPPPAALLRRVWAAAKAYWRPPDAAAAAAAAAAVAGVPEPPPAPHPPAAVNGAAAPAGRPASQGQQQGGGGGGGDLAALVAAVKAGGATLTRPQVEAARRLLELREGARRRREAAVSSLWALSVLGGSWLFEAETEALLQVAAPSLPAWRLSGREAADVLWALANARHWTPLLPALEAAVVRAGGLRVLRPPQVAAVLWSFATLGHAPTDLLRGLAQGWAAGRGGESSPPPPLCRRRCGLRALSTGQLSAAVWSLAAMGQARSDAFGLAWAEVCRRGPALAGQKHHLVQIWQAALALRLEGGGGEVSGGEGGGEGQQQQQQQQQGQQQEGRPQQQAEGVARLLAAAEAAFVGEAAALRGKSHSSYQRGIANALTSMRVMHALEDSTTGYSVDIAIPSLRVAIEADGPSHISRTKRPPPAAAGGAAVAQPAPASVQLGATRMKARHLAAMGWAVVNVTYQEWDALGGAADKEAFLRRRIERAVAGGG
ncbi:MAG: hypothetical protein J3K34DRAFT_517884 [Monoraphidium minutum]|nr:MAG: hypothetical protein J3K34DRAFT_517884 [Monoraphidium minutum]